MKSEIFVRWHSRAGQGAVTAAHFLSEALASLDYKVQSFPDFGAEKRGAPVVVFNRLSKTASILDDPAHLTFVNLVVLLDPTLIGNELDYDSILEHLDTDGALIINTAKTIPSVFNARYKGGIYHLNATGIALDTIGRNVPNVALIGGLSAVLKISQEIMEPLLEAHLSTFFPDKIVQKNLEGFRRGYNEIIEIK